MFFIYKAYVLIVFMAPKPFVSKESSLFFVKGVIKNASKSSQKKRDLFYSSSREVFLCFVSLSDTTMEEKDDQYLTDVLSYSAERLAKVNRDYYYVDY
jgi:hypothetical protein